MNLDTNAIADEFDALAESNGHQAANYWQYVWPNLKSRRFRNALVAFRFFETHDVARVVFAGIAAQIRSGGVIVVG